MERHTSARSRSPHTRVGRRTSTMTPDEDKSVAKQSSGRSVKLKSSADPELVERAKGLLTQYLGELESEHQYVVKNDLRMAMRAVKSSKPVAIDKVSPFKSIKSISTRDKADLKKDRISTLSARIFFTAKNPQAEFKMYIPKRITVSPTSSNGVPPIPAFMEYTSLRSNIVVEDDEDMRYHPYIGEDGKTCDELSFELSEAYVDKTSSAGEDAKKTEKAILYADFIHKFLADAGVDIELIKSYLIGDLPAIESMIKDRQHSLPEGFDYSDQKVLNAKKKLRRDFSIGDLKKAEAICKAFIEKTKISIWEVVKRVDLGLQSSMNPMRSTGSALPTSKRMGPSKGIPVALDPLKPFESYTYMYCQICHMFNCQYHEHVFEGLSPHIPKICTRREAAASPYPAKVTCSDDCAQLQDVNKPKASTNSLSETEKQVIEASCNIFAHNPRASCLLTSIVNKPCSVIHAYIRERKLSKPEQRVIDDDEESFTILKHKRKRAGGMENYPADCRLTAHADERDNPKPCAHAGPCTAECPCVVAKVACEKFCLCDKSCPRRWKGCNCHALNVVCTQASKCDCLKWGRECDPDLCLDCGAKQGLAHGKSEDVSRDLCHNISIQRDKAKRTLIGVSNLSGIGLFIGEDVAQAEYLGEYKGEIVSHNEAERRGKIYDVKRVSFLFNLNQAQAVDATRAGNKFRFVNHYRKPNCYARIFLVNGVHRIGMYAKRRLYAGEELYFNYGYNQKTVEFVEGEPKFNFEPPASATTGRAWGDDDDGADELRLLQEAQGDSDTSYDGDEAPRANHQWELEDSAEDVAATANRKVKRTKKKIRGG